MSSRKSPGQVTPCKTVFCLFWKNIRLHLKSIKFLLITYIFPLLIALWIFIWQSNSESTAIPEKSFEKFSPIQLPKELSISDGNKYLHFTPNVDIIKPLVEEASTFLSLKGVKGHDSVKELETELLNSKDFAGVEFPSDYKSLKALPKFFSYSLRFPGRLRSNKSEAWITTTMIPHDIKVGARNPDDNDDGVPVGYYKEGFLALQAAVSYGYLTEQSKTNKKKDSSYSNVNKGGPEIFMHRFPYPEYNIESFDTILVQWLHIFIILAYWPGSAYIVRTVSLEKKYKIKDYLRRLDIHNKQHWAAWFLESFLHLFLIAIILGIILIIPLTDKGAILNETSIVIIFLLLIAYSIQQTCFCLAFGVLIDNPLTAVIVYSVVHLGLMFPINSSVMVIEAIIFSLIPNLALKVCCLSISYLESINEETRLSNFFSQTVITALPLSIIMLLMILSTWIYRKLYLYLDRVIRSESDQNFFVANAPDEDTMRQLEEEEEDWLVEQESLDAVQRPSPTLHAGIKLINVRVKIGKFYALKNFYLTACFNEVTTLWGCAGAGKTTLISLLTGAMPPTRGKVEIWGKDIVSDRKKAMRNVAPCLKDNYLFPNLNAVEHLKFFGRLRGFKGEDLKQEVSKYLSAIGLPNNDKLPISRLSPNIQRKLAVCCAFCGDCPVVLLHDPCAGMDKSSKYQLWDMIKREKAGRTVLVLTSDMDEAEILGDRMGIMQYGELKSFGKPFFLRAYYGPGYRLVIVKAPEWTSDKVTPFLKARITTISIFSHDGDEIVYKIPEKNVRELANILKELEEKQEQLKIKSLHVGITRIDENVIDSRPARTRGHKARKKSKKRYPSLRYVEGITFFKNHCHAMLLKKFLYTWHNGRLAAIQFFLPLLLLLNYVGINSDGTSQLEPLKIGDKEYSEARLVVDTSVNIDSNSDEYRIKEEYLAINGLKGLQDYIIEKTGSSDVEKFILAQRDNYTQGFIDTRFLGGFSTEPKSVTGWLSNQYLHTPPLTLNLLLNAIFRSILGSEFEVHVTNHPLPFYPNEVLENAKKTNESNRSYAIIRDIGFLMAIISAFYIVFPIKERVRGMKRLQFMAGVSVWIFWYFHLWWDMVTYTFTAISITAVLYYMEIDGLCEFGHARYVLLILLVFGPCMLGFTYLVSHTQNHHASAAVNYVIFNFLYLILVPIIQEAWPFLGFLTNVFPILSLQAALSDIHIIFRLETVCNSDYIRQMDKAKVCDSQPDCCDLKKPLSFGEPTALNEMFWMLVFALFWFLCLFISYYFVVWEIASKWQKRWLEIPKALKMQVIDDDVEKERLEVNNILYTDFVNTGVLVNDVTKYYFSKGFMALRRISFRVKTGECFGLLGPSASGKTTILQTISGDCRPTQGTVYVKAYTVQPLSRVVLRQIGYCHDTNAFFPDFTGRENLIIFGLLRGITWSATEFWARKIARIMHLHQRLGHYAKDYTVADKRKLSLAIAATGRQPILLLDEPTNELDPESKREIWQVVKSMTASGYRIVLASKDIEECSTLCNRMMVIINGQFKYIGSKQKLAQKICDMWTIRIKIVFNENAPIHRDFKAAREFLANRVASIKAWMEKFLPNARVVDEYGTFMLVRMKTNYMPLSKIFEIFNAHRVEQGIEEYFVSLQTFEDKFQEMAETQLPRRKK